MPDNGDMEKYIADMMNLVDQIIALGENLAENLQLALLLCSLPESYENFVTALEGRPDGDLTREIVKGKLLQENHWKKENWCPQTDVPLKVY